MDERTPNYKDVANYIAYLLDQNGNKAGNSIGSPLWDLERALEQIDPDFNRERFRDAILYGYTNVKK